MVKPGQFNAEINRINATRARQTRVRQQVSAINGGPTYLRTAAIAGAAQKKAEVLGTASLKSNFAKKTQGYRSGFFGDIYFNNAGNQGNYEAAVSAAQEVDYNAAPTDYRSKFPIDDPEKNSQADMWSASTGAGQASNSTLYAEAENDLLNLEKRGTAPEFDNSAERADYVAELYKEKYTRKYGALRRPFKDSTMQLSLPSDNRDAKIANAVAQLIEMEEGIASLEKALYQYNQLIKDSEQSYYSAISRYSALQKQAVQYAKVIGIPMLDAEREEIHAYLESEAAAALAEKQSMEALLAGGPGTTGLRDKAKEVRGGIHALQKQRATVQGALGIDAEDVNAKVASARGTGTAIGGTVGMGAGIVAALGLVWLFRNQAPGTRRRPGDDPISIFTN